MWLDCGTILKNLVSDNTTTPKWLLTEVTSSEVFTFCVQTSYPTAGYFLPLNFKHVLNSMKQLIPQRNKPQTGKTHYPLKQHHVIFHAQS